METKTVYVAMCGDIIHYGHINIINQAAKLGKVIVGLHTDEVVASLMRLPVLTYEERKQVIENIKGVSEVIPQTTYDQVPNLRKLKPDFVVHGTDWCQGPDKYLRDRAEEAVKEWGGKIVDIPYTEGVSLDKLNDLILRMGTTDVRRAALRRMLAIRKHLTVLEAHNGLTGLIVEKTRIQKEGHSREFDAMWISSLCDSTAKGKPDIELVDVTSRLNTINEIMEVTTKPIIVDGDTGGKIEHFTYTVKSLERVGVSAIIIEDKVGLKKNSLFGTTAKQTQDSIEGFCEKIRAGKAAQVTEDFMIFARIESLILKQGMEDALARAKAYIAAGADGIMIHSIDKTGEEIFEFCHQYNQFPNRVPLVVVPTAYNQIYEQQLFDAGINIVIHANHLIRSGYKAMQACAVNILEHERSYDCNDMCLSIKEILTLIDE